MQTSSIALLLFWLGVVACQVEVPVVQTTFGSVRGVYEDNEDGQFFHYMGIPYARPPLDNKFGDPIDPGQYDGILEANDDSTRCAQREEFNNTLVGSSDCLDLHVLVPANRTSNDPMSVYFWIYGGALRFGFAGRFMWGAEKLARQDVIVVTINYRVGVFGFLCLGSELLSGNTGLKDLLEGLKWVNENIEAFGGKSDDITIGGSSAGAYAAEFLIASPQSFGLFQRAILQSGSILTTKDGPWISSHEHVLRLASYFGFRGGSIDGALRFLHTINDLDLVEASEQLGYSSFTYCVEPNVNGIEPFLTEAAPKLLNEGLFHPVDVLIGFTSREAASTVVSAPVLDESHMRLFYEAVEYFDMSDEERENLANTIRYYYLGSQNITANVTEELIDFYSDMMFIYTVLRSADVYKRTGKSVYLYEFSYDGGRNFNKLKSNFDFPGAMHADEIGYLFNQFLWGEVNEEDGLIIERMTQMWTNFIKYGDPTPNVTDTLTVKWLPLEENANNYIIIDSILEVAVDPVYKRKSFWDIIYMNYAFYDSL